MEIAFHSCVLGGLIFLLVKFYRGPFPKWSVYLGVSLKLTFGIILGYYYLQFREGGDTLGFYYRLLALADQIHTPYDYLISFSKNQLPWFYGEGRTDFFLKLVFPIAWICKFNFWLTGLYLSFLSFLATWYFVRTTSNIYPHLRWMIYYAFLLFPSVIFWSTGIMKESIVNSLLSISFALIFKAYYENRRAFYIISILPIFLLFLLKFYLLPPILLGLFWVFIHTRLNIAKTILAFSAFLLISFFSLVWIHPWLSLDRLPITIYENFSHVLQNSQEPISGMALKPTYLSLFKHSLVGIVTALYRPLIWEYYEILSWPYKIENVYLIVFSIISLSHFRRIKASPLLVGTMIFIISLSVIISLTTPNYGSLYRYKSTFLPYFVCIVSIIPFQKYILQKAGN